METKKQAITYEIDYKCPKCETGRLRPTGQCLTTNPPQYPHECNECDYCEIFMDKIYPYIDYL